MLDLKLRPPVPRMGLVSRSAVLELLRSASSSRVVAIVAPPGYGKTTVMGQFRSKHDGPSAWLTLDATDSDPAVLLRSLAKALLAGGMVDESLVGDLPMRSDEVITSGVGALVRALLPIEHGVLLLDQVDHLHTQSSLDVIGAIMTRLAGPIQVVVSSRSGAGLPLPLLRSQGAVTEVTTSNLAMDLVEGAALFEAAGVPVDEVGLHQVMERTEGWPAGLYLTAIAIRAGAPSPGEFEVRGSDFYLADYLRQELMSQIPEDVMDFLIRTSILDRLTGPLCDFVLEAEKSAEKLLELENSNLLIIPIDRTRTWYRYHSLLLDFLRAELQRTYPGQVARLHSRAATWFEDHGFPDQGIDHVQSAGEGERFAEAVFRLARRAYSEGRMETLSGWLSWLEDAETIDDYPELAAMGAFARSLEGDVAGAERMAGFAFIDSHGGQKRRDDLGPFALLLRSAHAAHGLDEALADGKDARTGFEQRAEWIHVAIGYESLALLALEGVEVAETRWIDGLWRSESLGAHPYTSFGWAERAVVAIRNDDWASAEQWADEALGLIRDHGLERYLTSVLGYTVAARVAARRGDTPEAKSLLGQAMAARPRLSPAMPILSVQALLEMAKAFLEVADVAGARRATRDAGDIIAARPRLGLLVDEYNALKERLSSLPAGIVGPSSLTKAELRLLPLLVTHLTYPEIGERLYVSRHTVKTQAMSIYRKLAVSSRTEAVTKAREVGILSV